MGDARREPLEAILSRVLQDPILDTIRWEGPSGLYRALQEDGAIPAGEDPRRLSMCQLCLELTDRPDWVERLRKTLEQPQHRSRRKVLAAVFEMQQEAASSGSGR